MDKSTAALAAYAHGISFDDIPPEVLESAKSTLVDTLGCAMGGYGTGLSATTRAMAEGVTCKSPARVLGSQAQTSPQMAAFANGAMVHALDFNDVYMSQSTVHPSDALSGVLAVADALGASGRDLLLATVLSHEISCNLADAIPREQGVDNTYYCLVGGTAASAKLMGLDLERFRHAMSLAVVSGVALEQTRTGALSMWKNCAGANAARNAVFTAEAARAGLTGPDAPIEGKWGLWNLLGVKFDWAPFGGKGTPWRIAQANIKRYPAVAHAQSPITAALQVREGLRIDDIEAIAIESYWVAKRFDDPKSPLWNPTSHETAGGAIPYLVAAALVDGDVTEETLSHEHLANPRLKALVGKTTIRETDAFNALYPEAWPCRIEITLRSGERKVAETRYFKGHAKSPLSRAEVETKFRQLASPVMRQAAMDEALVRLWNLELVEDTRTVLDLFTATPR